MSVVGKSVLTAKGLLALTDATRLGKKIVPKYFRVSSRDYDIYPGIDLEDLENVWLQDNISGVFPIDQNTTEFLVDIPPEKASDFGKTFGLYLEDGTLFLVGKPPYPFAPLMRQTFKLQLVWSNANEIVDFKYIPFYETEQDLSLLDTTSSITLAVFDIQAHLTVLEDLLKKTSKQFNEFRRTTKELFKRLSTQIDRNQTEIERNRFAFLDFSTLVANKLLSTIDNITIGKLFEFYRSLKERLQNLNSTFNRHLRDFDALKTKHFQDFKALRTNIDDLDSRFNAFKSSFRGNLQDNGYYWINAKLLIQWGKVTVEKGHGVFDFPVPFPTTCFQITASDVGAGCHSVGISPISHSQFEVWTKDAGKTPKQTGVRFIAIGF